VDKALSGHPAAVRPPSSERRRDGGLLASDWTVAILLLAYAIAMRVVTWGDPNFFVDDSFYLLVGQRMHDGFIPYVDIWDRKPFGLFAVYYLIAGLSRQVAAYQITGMLFATSAAFAIHRMVSSLTSRQGGVLAAIAYLCLMCTFDGVNGQAPVFYNTLIAWSAWCVLSELDRLEQGRIGWKIWTAMALCGLAITIKQTSLFESAFFGIFVLFKLRQAGRSPRQIAPPAVAMALIGALPTLAIAAAYALSGHWHEYWTAMVHANLDKPSLGVSFTLKWVWAISGRIVLIAGIVIWSVRRGVPYGREREFLIGWLCAALIGFVIIPNFFLHYVLPLLVPFSVFAGYLYARPDIGRIWLAATLCFNWIWYNPLAIDATRKSVAAMDRLAAMVRDHDGGGGLFVFDGPPYLYAMTGKKFLSPLVFPHHFNHLVERNASHIATQPELARVLAGGPGIIIDSPYPRNFPPNWDSVYAVKAYEARHCRLLGTVKVWEMGFGDDLVVYGDCRPGGLQRP
jgi:hypothetical protein